MAKASLWQRIKGWFSGNKSAKSSGSSGSSQRTSNYYSSRKDGGTGYYRRAMLNSLRGKEEEEKPKYRSMAEATKKEPPKEKSSFAKLDSALKKDVPDPKRAAAQKSQERAKESLNKTVGAVKKWSDSNKQQEKEFNERTNHKYDVKYWEEKGDKKKAQEARIRVKSGENVSDIVAEELAVKYHPTAYSAARGAASGATFGASELAIKAQAKRDKERAKNEQYYQENKNKTAETVGELAGALASFGATAGATEKLGAKVVSKAAPRAAERLAEKKVVQGLAKRGVNKAVKKGLVSEATEELIKQAGKEKAEKIVGALGTDIVQNLTTGAIYDINKASAQHEVGSKDWWKELGTSAAFNFGITGGVAGGSILGGNKKAAIEAADELGRLGKAGFVKQAPDAKVSLGRKRRTDVVLPNERPLTANVGETVESVAKNADEAVETVAKDTRLKEINRELDAAYDEIARSGDMPEERLSALIKRTDDLKAERDALEKSVEMPKGTKPAAETLKANEETAVRDIPFTTDEGRPITGEDNFATVDDDIPVDNLNQTRLNDTKAEAQDRARRVMEEPPKEEPIGAAKQTSEAAEEAGEREFSQGQKEAREAYYKKTGTRLEDGKAATDDQILESLGNYERSQGTSAERKLSKVAYSQVSVSSEEAAEKLLKMQDEGAFGYDVVHHKDMYKEVADDLANDWDRWVDKICDVAEGGDWSGKESTKLLYMSQYLSEITDAAKSPEQDALAQMAWKATQKLSTTSAQTLNGRRAYAHLSKASKMECALDDMVSVLDGAIGFNKQHRKAMMGLNKYERQHYIKGQLLKDEKIKGCLKKLANAKTDDEISEAYTEMLYQFNKSNPKSGFDVVQELRYLNMLGNPKTHIRNMFGSGFFSPMRQVSNMIRGSIEDRIAKEAGLEITKHGGLSLSAAKEAWAKEPKTEAGKAALEAFESVKKDLLGSAKYDTPTYAGRGKTLVGKAIDKLSDFNSSLLSKEDDFFKSRAFKENYIKSYNKYLKDGVPITDKIKKQIEQEAFQEAQIATFNEYNEFAKWLSNITRKANDANASTLARWGARGVNAVMPFTKVPANLMKQSINYSPIGIAKGMLNIKQAAKKGDAVLLNRAIDELSSGLTGTAVFGLGMLLGKTTDMFTTNTGKNDPAAKFKKDRGMQNYSITFKDPDTGQGHSFTLDWLVPTSATFFSGVEMANQLKRGDFDILDIGNDWSTVMTRLAEPVMETSMLSGLHGMLETMRSGSDSDDAKSAIQVLLRETAQSYMSSMIPTVLGQASRTAYKSDMQITGEDDWEYFWNQTKSKAGLANTNILGEALGADTDAYGNIKGEKNSASDYVKSGLKNFLSPANIQKVDFSEVDNEKLRVYEDAVKNGADPNDMAYLFPKKQYKKQFSVAGEDVKMSNKDLSTYNQAKTKGGEEGMRYILENIMFNRYDYDSKGKKVPTAEAYTKAEKQALMEQFKGKSMREVEEWLYQQPEFKNASKAEQKKAISGLWGLSKDTKTVASQRVGEQAVYKAQGKDVNEYNFKNEITESKRDQLQPYIDSGLLTYEEAVDFARNGGKVSYTEDEDGGGSATTYYSKAAMIDYFVEHGIPYDKAEALYNAFKAKNAKPYSGNNKSSGRRGYGGYRRRGGGGRKAKVPTIDAKSMAAATKKAKGTTVKLEPPKPKTTKVTTKFKDYKI